jgi:hypothetical protein
MLVEVGVFLRLQPGVRLPAPGRNSVPLHDARQLEWMDKEVARLEAIRAIEETVVGPGTVICGVHLVPKQGPKQFRMVIDQRRLNALLQRCPCRGAFSSAKEVLRKLEEHTWFASRDMQDAYFHFIVHESSRPLLTFRWRNRIWRFRVLPFGLQWSPYVFTEVMGALVRKWAEQGLLVLAYYDDLTVMEKTKEQCASALAQLVAHCERLGLRLDPVKGNPAPTQQGVLLGIWMDAASGIARIPDNKQERLLAQARSMLEKGVATPRELYSLASRIVAYQAASVIRRFSHALYREARKTRGWDTRGPLGADVKKELEDLVRSPKGRFERRFRWLNESYLDITTDASKSGWGAVVKGLGKDLDLAEAFSAAETEASSNEREVSVPHRALQELVRRGIPIRGMGVRIWTDNTSARAYLKRGGGPVLALHKWAASLWTLLEVEGAQLVDVYYIPGKENSRADANSRRFAQGPRLTRMALERVERRTGPLTPWPPAEPALWTGRAGICAVRGEAQAREVLAEFQNRPLLEEIVLVLSTKEEQLRELHEWVCGRLGLQVVWIDCYPGDFKDEKHGSNASSTSVRWDAGRARLLWAKRPAVS